jgi:GNAT superfamily N-acetyltransferase
MIRPEVLRPGRDDDAEAVIALITACWAEYPGCIMDVDGENPDLRALASHFAQAGGALWVAEQDGVLVGMVAVRPTAGPLWELCRMYVAKSQHGTGLAQRLLATAETHARGQEAKTLELWTDTRFDRAHRFYERSGFVRAGPIRALHDIANSLEYHYEKPLSGPSVRPLDAAAASSAARTLGRVLQGCVESGASVSFLPPMPLETAEAFFRRKATDVAQGNRILLAAWLDGTLAGTVSVDLDTPQNQPHRAEIQKLLVHPNARRHGLANDLMAEAERLAAEAGRTLLTLDTRASDAGERLYRARGWTECGRIPDYSAEADGSLSATVLFYKRV